MITKNKANISYVTGSNIIVIREYATGAKIELGLQDGIFYLRDNTNEHLYKLGMTQVW